MNAAGRSNLAGRKALVTGGPAICMNSMDIFYCSRPTILVDAGHLVSML